MRAAGSDYPADISALYLQLPDGALGPESEKILAAVKASGARNAYDTADAIVRLLQDPANFTYSIDIRGVDCTGVSVVECFARAKAGYCEYYASTMAVLLRELGIPARFVEGYLPGSRQPGSNTISIRNDEAHAWVEVYFPRYGWVTFDPTGGGVGQNTPLPPGEPVSSFGPGPLEQPRSARQWRSAPEQRWARSAGRYVDASSAVRLVGPAHRSRPASGSDRRRPRVRGVAAWAAWTRHRR